LKVDKGSIIGTVIGLACLGIVLFEVSHGNFLMFYSQEGILLVGGGSLSVVFMAMPLEKVLAVPGYIRRFLFHKGRSQIEVVKMISEIAEKARRDGILSVESEMKRIEEFDKFLAAGLRMTIDGMDPSAIDATLRIEVMAMGERHKAGKKFFDLIKLYGPGWALAGTLIGQIGMFGNLEGADVGKLGGMLAIAVCATMYGTVLANAVAGPIGDKLGMRSAEELLNKEMVLQAVLSIQMGDNPRLTLDKMVAFIPQSHRAMLKAA
jgi:chemotaxis protein MotA